MAGLLARDLDGAPLACCFGSSRVKSHRLAARMMMSPVDSRASVDADNRLEAGAASKKRWRIIDVEDD